MPVKDPPHGEYPNTSNPSGFLQEVVIEHQDRNEKNNPDGLSERAWGRNLRSQMGAVFFHHDQDYPIPKPCNQPGTRCPPSLVILYSL